MPADPATSGGLPPDAVVKIRTVFANHPEVSKVILYGSRAKGNYRPGSDIDLTIHGPAVTLPELFAIEGELDDLLLPYKIDLSLHHQIDNPDLLEHIARVGVIIYSKEE